MDVSGAWVKTIVTLVCDKVPHKSPELGGVYIRVSGKGREVDRSPTLRYAGEVPGSRL